MLPIDVEAENIHEAAHIKRKSHLSSPATQPPPSLRDLYTGFRLKARAQSPWYFLNGSTPRISACSKYMSSHFTIRFGFHCPGPAIRNSTDNLLIAWCNGTSDLTNDNTTYGFVSNHGHTPKVRPFESLPIRSRAVPSSPGCRSFLGSCHLY